MQLCLTAYLFAGVVLSVQFREEWVLVAVLGSIIAHVWAASLRLNDAGYPKLYLGIPVLLTFIISVIAPWNAQAKSVMGDAIVAILCGIQPLAGFVSLFFTELPPPDIIAIPIILWHGFLFFAASKDSDNPYYQP